MININQQVIFKYSNKALFKLLQYVTCHTLFSERSEVPVRLTMNVIFCQVYGSRMGVV